MRRPGGHPGSRLAARLTHVFHAWQPKELTGTEISPTERHQLQDTSRASVESMIYRQQARARHGKGGAYPPAPAGWTIYAVGDIHGRLDLLEHVHRGIDADKSITGTDAIEVYLGDYIDRGPQSSEVLGALVKRSKTTATAFLRGNHEQMLLDFLGGRDLLMPWKAVGAVPTLLSYGLPARLLAGDVPEEEVREALGQRLPGEHFDFLTATGSYLRMDPYLMVHAGLRPGIRLEDQQAADILGIRNDFLDHDGDLGYLVVHGHTPVAEPDFRRYRINIDTGAFATNRLTCLRIGPDGASVLDTSAPG
jgi:calcineurin-like phosphoesterase family protein